MGSEAGSVAACAEWRTADGMCFSLVDYDPARLDELVAMWRASFEAGVGIVDPHPLAEQKQYFVAEVLPRHMVLMALSDGQLVGFVAASAESVAQCHVRVGWQRRGIGTRLLDWAKAQSGGSLWLYTFARNQGAQAFYASNGFEVTERGFEATWQLDDVKLAWSAATSHPG